MRWVCRGQHVQHLQVGLIVKIPQPVFIKLVITIPNHENRTCTANEWDAVIYAKVEDVLYGQKHTEPQCVALGGTVVTVEGDVKI